MMDGTAARAHAAHFEYALRKDPNKSHMANFLVHGVHGVFEFVRLVEGRLRRVQLVVVRRSPIETILRFSSSEYISDELKCGITDDVFA